MSGNTPFDCPRCLDKIIERVDAGRSPLPSQPLGSPAGGWTQPVAPPPQPAWQWGDRDRDDDRDRYRQHGKRRKSWLNELFD
ncbi:MAG: hypothetical protein J0H35_09260 [Rhodospirillales bacterium]|nr:hypothetical protein [Rhodospirillales bacterium]